MTAKEAIEIHLSAPRVEDGKLRYSAFIAALRDARFVTGRNCDTGEKPDPIKNGDDAKQLGCWLGAIGYLSLLDQIGKCFRPNTMTETSEKREIIKTLTYFSNLNEREK